MTLMTPFAAPFGPSDPATPVKDAAPLTQRQAVVTESGADAAAGLGTGYTMAVDDTFNGTLGTNDTDWVAVDLQAGQSYVVMVWGRGGSAAGVSDTIMRVYNGGGIQVAVNDDVGFSYFSLIEYTAPTSGTYYVSVTGFDGEAGRYTMQVADDVFSPDQVASYMVDFDWGFPTPIRFDVGVGGTITVNLTALNPNGQQLARWALESWSSVLGIDFVETSSSSAMIVFDENQAGAFAGPASFNPVTGIITQSTVNIGTGWITTNGTTIDSYSFQTYLHEIGHALGLGHAGPYGGFAAYGDDNVYRNDSTQITVMSYFDAAANTFIADDDVAIISPMLADILAVQRLNGTAAAYADDTTWGANSNVGGWLGQLSAILFDGANPTTPSNAALYSGGPIGLTIYDTGGLDTLDLSTVNVNQLIDLTPESVSNIAGFDGNLVMARGTLLENVIGGSRNDEIRGNLADNRIEAGAGNDTVNGGAGIDTAVTGVSRNDFTYSNDGTTVQINSSLGIDRYTNVEFFEFTDATFELNTNGDLVEVGNGPVSTTPSPGNDSLVGTADNDQIDGLDGDDTIEGGEGDDGLKGSGGNDSLVGGGGNDRLPGAAGDDRIFGGDGNDRLGGGDGADYMEGGDGNDRGGGGNDDDVIFGGAGNDVFSGGAGNDYIDVGIGDDRAAGSFGNDTVYGGAGNDTLGGGRGNDYIDAESGNDDVGAGEFNDTVFGGAGNDFLGGGDGDDFIDGGTGNDTINPGYGMDTVTGGAGLDVFVFNALSAGGTTVITDFQAGSDLIQVVGLRNPADPLARLNITDIAYQGQQAVTMGYGDHTIIVVGASEASLSADDFLFS